MFEIRCREVVKNKNRKDGQSKGPALIKGWHYLKAKGTNQKGDQSKGQAFLEA